MEKKYLHKKGITLNLNCKKVLILIIIFTSLISSLTSLGQVHVYGESSNAQKLLEIKDEEEKYGLLKEVNEKLFTEPIKVSFENAHSLLLRNKTIHYIDNEEKIFYASFISKNYADKKFIEGINLIVDNKIYKKENNNKLTVTEFDGKKMSDIIEDYKKGDIDRANLDLIEIKKDLNTGKYYLKNKEGLDFSRENLNGLLPRLSLYTNEFYWENGEIITEIIIDEENKLEEVSFYLPPYNEGIKDYENKIMCIFNGNFKYGRDEDILKKIEEIKKEVN